MTTRPSNRLAMLLLSAILPIWTPGCEWVQLPIDNTPYDHDGDGWDSVSDCDDYNRKVHPLGYEDCNGVDNNCSGDESDARDASLWYADLDEDTYGDPGSTITACDAPPGYVDSPLDCDDTDPSVFPKAVETDCADPKDYDCNGFPASMDTDHDGWAGCEDCDDSRPTVFPGAPEACNGVDDDCDGTIDNGDAPLRLWWLDLDGDGWGRADDPVEACDRPIGYSAEGTDCDDFDGARHPYAAETCDRVDNDCDDLVDELDRFGNTQWYLDTDGDSYGDDTDWEPSCEAVPGRIPLGGDCDDSDASIHPDAAEVCDEIDQDCDDLVDEHALDPDRWYYDMDRDGWGAEGHVIYACRQPDDGVAVPGDCDDRDALINPAADERCGGVDEDCDGELDEPGALDGDAWYADLDGDGWGDDADVLFECAAFDGRVSRGGDCDDTDVAFSPGALEIDCLDPVDYNCDGSVGRDDLDGDGWVACQDCDDSAADRSPDATEVCNELDDDCDGDTDEDALGTSWYRDADRDGYGDPLFERVSCTRPPGYVTADGDCDDSDAAVSPGAEETCETVRDDDCDGTANAGAWDCTPFYSDEDEDSYGAATACLCEPEAPYTASVDGDCDDADPETNPDGTEVCGDHADNNCDDLAPGCGVAGHMNLSDAAARITGISTGDAFGGAIASAGDLDADGYADLLIGAHRVDGGASDTGAVYLFHGPLPAAGTGVDAHEVWSGEAAFDGAGRSLANGDLDGDGIRDHVVGAPYDRTAGSSAGAIYLLLGPSTGGSLADADGKYTGTDMTDFAGTTLAVMDDFDRDGDSELAVGAYRESAESAGAGAVYVLDTAPTGFGALEDAAAILIGDTTSDFFGRALVGAGDLDGDGLGDLAVGAYGDDAGGLNAGTAYVYLGPLSGTVTTARADATRHGSSPGDCAGYSLAAGDIDADGYDDLLVGAINNDDSADEAGAAYLVRGPVLGTADLGAEATLLGEAAYDGASVALAVGDLDDDGFADVAVSGAGAARGGVGAVWIVYGPLSGVLGLADAENIALGEDLDDSVGDALAIPGDLDGDSYLDLLVTAPGEDSAGTDAGAVYLLAGGPGF